MSLAATTQIGPYEIISTLGAGAMGEVYLALDTRLNRNVALKIISPGSANDAGRRRRFEAEARAASSLNHPNIITVHDFGVSDGISYIVSELVDSESLRASIQRGPIPMRQLIEIALQIAEGLAAAHDSGIVHRDLKPENVMISKSGRVKILDFGLATPALRPAEANPHTTSDSVATEPGLILGTVGYMSPEQARGEAVSTASDQFSFGAILHEMASGTQAFKRDTPMQTLLAIANVDRVPFTPGPSPSACWSNVAFQSNLTGDSSPLSRFATNCKRSTTNSPNRSRHRRHPKRKPSNPRKRRCSKPRGVHLAPSRPRFWLPCWPLPPGSWLPSLFLHPQRSMSRNIASRPLA